MTTDAIPANEPLRPTADARPADEEDAPAETANAVGTTPEAGANVAEASAEGATDGATAEATAVGEAATAETSATAATDPAAATDVVEANAALAAAQAGAPAKTHPRRAAFARGMRRVLSVALTVALLVGGAAIGYQRFLQMQPVEQPVGDPVTSGIQPTPAVQELVAALATNDADAIRSAVPADPYKLLTNEMERWSFGEVSAVETLSTYVDGPRTSTAVVLRGTATDGSPVAINLVIQTVDGAIVSFR